MPIHISSPAFEHNQTIPPQYTRDGQDISPPLNWSGLPPQTRELALIVEDPDAPTPEPFVHWVMYKIPPDAPGLPEKVAKSAKTKDPQGAMQGKNSFKEVGYSGPAPPPGHGTHHYHFRVYALDKPLKVQAGLDHKALLASMSGHILADGEIVATYER